MGVGVCTESRIAFGKSFQGIIEQSKLVKRNRNYTGFSAFFSQPLTCFWSTDGLLSESVWAGGLGGREVTSRV